MAHWGRSMCDSVLIWLSRKHAMRYIRLSIRLLTETRPVCHPAQFFICSPVPAVCAVLHPSPHATWPAASRWRQLPLYSHWGFFSSYLCLICKCDKTPYSPNADSPRLSCNDATLNWKCILMSGHRGTMGAVHSIRRDVSALMLNAVIRRRICKWKHFIWWNQPSTGISFLFLFLLDMGSMTSESITRFFNPVQGL